MDKKKLAMIQYLSDVCDVVKSKSSCDRSQVGTVIFNDDYEIIATGYNGAVRGLPSCGEAGHLMRDGHCVRTVHSEVNAIAQCARVGKSCRGCSALVTYVPCENCAKILLQAGIKAVYAKQIRYTEGYDLLILAGVPVLDINCQEFDRNTGKT